MIWIIETIDNNELETVAKNAGHTIFKIRCEKKTKPNYSEIPNNIPTLYHGSWQTAEELITSRPDLKRALWCTIENYNCTKYYPQVEQYLLNRKHIICTLEQLKQNMWDVYRNFGIDSKIFIRPNSGKKSFTGQLLDIQDFDRFWNHESNNQVTNENTLIIAKPLEINGEWRFVVSNDQEIIATSTYMYQGNRTLIPCAPEGATKLVTKLLKILSPPDPMFTIDVSELKTGEFNLLEINSFSTAGLYASNKTAIIKKATKLATQIFNKNFK